MALFSLSRLRGALGNALVWGAGWFTAALGVMVGLSLVGLGPGPFSWSAALGAAARFGVMGSIAGAAFSSFIRLRYHGRRLSDINWVRFGLGGGIVTGLFVPAFIVVARMIDGDPFLPLEHLLRNGLLAAAFGGTAAGVTLKLAQRAEALLSGRSRDRLEAPRELATVERREAVRVEREVD